MEALMIEREIIKEIIKEAFEESTHFRIHEAHHDWIQARIDSEKSRNAMCLELTKSIVQWSVIGILTYMAIWLKDHFIP